METNPQETVVQEPVVTVQSPAAEEHRSQGVTAMVLGIVSDVLVWYPVLNIAGFVLAIIALVKSNKNRQFAFDHGVAECGQNVAGKWCGIGGIVVGAVTILLYLAAIAAILFLSVGVISSTGAFQSFFPVG